MDSQQQSVYNFSQQMNSTEKAPSSSQQTTATTGVVLTPIYREPHILDREPHIHLETPFDKLEFLCETLVDFENMKRNGVDLTKELKNQGWENYFQCLYGPEALKDQREIPNVLYLFSKIDPPEVIAYYLEDLYKQGVDITEFLVEWLPEHPPNFMKRMREPSEKSKKAKQAKLGESSGSRTPVPLVGSPAQLQSRALASQNPSHPEPEPEVTSPPLEHPNPTTSEPQPSEPTHYEPQPSEPTHSDIPPPITSADPTTPTLNLSAPISSSSPSPASANEPETTLPTLEEVIKVFVESSVEKVKDAEIRLQEHLAREAEERERKEAEEKARLEELQRIREAKAKAADADAAEAEEKAKADAEEAARIAEEATAKAKADELTQGEHSNSGFVPLVLKTLEELQKEQQIVRARLDQQDSININIQNMIPQLLQRMPPPPNP
ncbi:eukaryotic translation initiation factor 4 gamma-like [Lathyrus oleraceus]|uniref:eukaryotic translation initiation factor 4 gamma-like n=1 Tax=Pisum sativum TaxID=3888 RepID=UPI0021CE98E8|nr:eukaryotic translation initiation factor 4 gamma-like [Pisum sativum]